MFGVTDIRLHLANGVSKLKRELVFLDGFVFVGAEDAIDLWRNGPHQKQRYDWYANEVEYLLNQKIAIQLDNLPDPTTLVDKDIELLNKHDITISENYKILYKNAMDLYERYDAKLSERLHRQSLLGQVTQTEAHELEEELRTLNYDVPALLTRVVAVLLNEGAGLPSLSLHSLLKSYREPTIDITRRGEIYRIAVEGVPVPDDGVPWERIFELKSDGDFNYRVRRMHQWISDFSTGSLTRKEISDAVETSIYEYESFMNLHDIQTRSSAIEFVVVGGAEVFEDVLKFRFGKLVKRLFSARREKVDLLIAEKGAPGRELSCVSKARAALEE